MASPRIRTRRARASADSRQNGGRLSTAKRSQFPELYADGEDAIQYAEAAHVASTLIDDSVARLDLVRLRPQIEELKRGRKPDDGTMLRDSASELYKLGDGCKIYCT